MAEIAPEHRGQLDRYAASAGSSLVPADPIWLSNRLSTMQLAMAQGWSDAKATAWLHETQRLLADLPSDILGWALDEAVKASPRGFVPSVGEIRAYADPRMADRKRVAARLAALAAFDPAAALPAQEPSEYATPDQAAAILAEFGMKAEDKAAVRRHLGPPREPTAADLVEVAKQVAIDMEADATPVADIAGLSILQIDQQAKRLKAERLARAMPQPHYEEAPTGDLGYDPEDLDRYFA